jgi:enediyne biosynthesis protein E4
MHCRVSSLRFSRVILSVILSLTLVLAFGPLVQQPVAKGSSTVTFEEVLAKTSGILWTHDNAMSPERHLPETTGAGCAFLDYDNDGWMDIYLVNSGPSDFFTPKAPLKNALYRNNHDGTFSDVTSKAGVAGGQFGMGVAVGDYDNDGWQDIYVTNYGKNLLYHNLGNGKFEEVAEQAGVAVAGWSTSAVWFDFDNDGRLDLFVSSFAEYNKNLTALCADETSRPHYCIPRLFKPTPSHLFRNNGDGRFVDVSRESGIAESLGKAFGVVATDVNNDGLIDLFVASDTVANFLFQNLGKGKFEEIGLWAGVAYSEAGSPRSGMGVDATDYDGDGWQDLFVANVDHQSFSLYHNRKDLTFADEAAEIGKATRLLSGWGLRFFDYDNDGYPDLFLANGHPDDMVEQHIKEVTYKEPLFLFQNNEGVFKNVSGESGVVFSRNFPARGLATGDFDSDGDLDVLISNNGEAPLLLRNQGGNLNHWLGLQLVATQSNPSAVGTLISWDAGGAKRRRLKTGGGSYLSSHDPREILGLGLATKVDLLEIRWPSGKVDKITDLPVDTYVRVVEGRGLMERQ